MSDSAVTLFGADYSVYTRIVRLALEEKGVPYEFEAVDIFAHDGPPDGYLERHPFARIPAFEHDGFKLYEAGAVTRYVDEAFPGPALQPDGTEPRARMSQVMSILDSYGFKSLVWDVFFERVRAPQVGRASDETKIEAGLEMSGACLSALNGIKADNTWLVGPDVSLADTHAYPMFALFRLAPEGLTLLEEYPALVDWYLRFGERASAKATRHPLES